MREEIKWIFSAEINTVYDIERVATTYIQKNLRKL
jgi:hypothetical protein